MTLHYFHRGGRQPVVESDSKSHSVPLSKVASEHRGRDSSSALPTWLIELFSQDNGIFSPICTFCNACFFPLRASAGVVRNCHMRRTNNRKTPGTLVLTMGRHISHAWDIATYRAELSALLPHGGCSCKRTGHRKPAASTHMSLWCRPPVLKGGAEVSP